jgi:hypothetical protein
MSSVGTRTPSLSCKQGEGIRMRITTLQNPAPLVVSSSAEVIGVRRDEQRRDRR